uniref:Uncharacterized protein n=1 Tax=Rousettus aegyptiacus TaxID=9407 RepID=A0A7J8F067_ROUAE|nr:hypothetical protein HJG63_012216 [Rousettus aegyptiacus]
MCEHMGMFKVGKTKCPKVSIQMLELLNTFPTSMRVLSWKSESLGCSLLPLMTYSVSLGESSLSGPQFSHLSNEHIRWYRAFAVGVSTSALHLALPSPLSPSSMFRPVQHIQPWSFSWTSSIPVITTPPPPADLTFHDVTTMIG